MNKKRARVITKWITPHITHKNKDGETIPSVTKIIGILDKPGIPEWANHLGFKRKTLKKELAHAALLGSLVHRAIEIRKLGLMCEIRSLTRYDVDIDKMMNILEQYLEFEKDHNPKMLFNELQLKTDLYTGTCDDVSIISGAVHLIDYKTSNVIRGTHLIQLAAYNKILRERGCITDKCSILVLPKKCNGYKLHSYDTSYIEEYYEPIFLKLLDLYYMWGSRLKEDFNEKIK